MGEVRVGIHVQCLAVLKDEQLSDQLVAIALEEVALRASSST